MKFAVAFIVACFAAVALSAPTDQDTTVLRYDADNIGVDGYKYQVELSDGQKRVEEGEVKQVDSENSAIAVRGSFTYVGDDGQVYSVNYVADENGFQPQGAHLPVAPQA